MAEDVTIAEAVKQIREQLEEAQSDGAGKGLRFLAKSVEVELSIVFKSGLEGSGGAKAWFVEASGKARSEHEASHKITLTLEPVGRDGKPALVSSNIHEK